MSIYHRITVEGTLSEPKGVPDPAFSLPSTINWMRGLALLVRDKKVDHEFSKSFYSSVAKRDASNREVNTTLEQLLFALHQCSALRALKSIPSKADVARVGIVTLYYGVYAAASAMVAAKDGSFQDNHTCTAGVWDRQISTANLIACPFDYRVTTLVKNDAKIEVENLRSTERFNLNGQAPQSIDEAYGACHSYFSGSTTWLREKTEKDIMLSKDFKNLNVSNFRTKKAREFRDQRLSKKTLCFLHQASRYRGKANYREALFLGYGKNTDAMLGSYIDDLSSVLDSFVCQAGIFCSRRLGKSIWKEFLGNLETSRSFSLSPTCIWGSV